MDEKKKDLRIIKTRKALYNAFEELMKSKPFEQIKVSDICNEALINRSTFYDHYADKYDLCITAMTSVPVPSLKLFYDPEYAGWSDDEYLQELLGHLNSSQTIEEALDIWNTLQLYSFEYLPVIVAGHYNSGYLYRKELKGGIENNGFYFYNAYF